MNFEPVALFSEAKLVTSSGKHLAKIDNLHLVCLMHKTLTTNHQTGELLYGFEESDISRRQELTNNVVEKGTIFLRIKFRDLFGFADQEKKVVDEFGYTLSLTRNNTNDPIIRDDEIAVAKVYIKYIVRFIQQYDPRMGNQQVVMKQILDKDSRELYCTKRIVFRKMLTLINNWGF